MPKQKDVRYKILVLFSLIFLSSTEPCKASFDINYLNTQNGLSNNYVTSVCQDNLGFIWFGTSDGLNRWDGNSFKIFRNIPNDSTSLPDNFIRSLSADNNGNVWIGTNQAGLVCFNIKNECFYTYPINNENSKAFKNTFVRTIYKQNNNFYFGTNAGLAYYNTEQNIFAPIELSNKNKQEEIISIFKINHVTVGVQSNIGLYKITDHKVQALKLPDEFNNLPTLTENNPIFYASNGDIWFADPDKLMHFENDKQKLNVYTQNHLDKTSISSTDISGIYEDSRKNIWITTWDAGANLFNAKTKTFKQYTLTEGLENKLSDNIITNIFEDSYKNLWITTETGGINCISLTNSNISYHTINSLNNKGLLNSKVGALYPLKNGKMLIGTGKGTLSEFSPETQSFKHFIVKNNATSLVLGISGKSNNKYYITGWDLGLYEYNIENYTASNILKKVTDLNYNKSVHENIRSSATDKNGFIWLPTHSQQGIVIYHPDSNELYDSNNPGSFPPQLFKIPFPEYIFIDSKNRIWITSKAGLFMYNGSDCFEFKAAGNSEQIISSNYVYSIYEDNYGVIWLGSSAGLDRIEILNEEITITPMHIDGYSIPGNIKSIITDNKKRVWFSSGNDIVCYNPISQNIRYFKANPNAQLFEFTQAVSTISSNGELYFGTNQGFLRFYPDSVYTMMLPAPIFITDFRLFNKSQAGKVKGSVLSKSILYTDTVVLNYNQNVIGIEFSALDYNSSEKIEYKYLLNGVDKHWIKTKNNSLITYAHLPHGAYDFKVQSNFSDSNTSFAQLHIVIKPPVWKTKIAYISYLIVLILIIIGVVRSIKKREQLKNDLKLQKLKIQNVEETNLMKLRFFTNISHEFRTPLTLIKAPLEKLIKTNKAPNNETLSQHKLMLKSANRLDKLLTQLMDYRKMEAGSLVLEPSVGNIVDFCKAIYTNFKILAQQKHIAYTFYSSTDSFLMAFDADKLEKVISNLISNAFKNTAAQGQIKIALNFDKLKHNIIIDITDTGIGIAEKDQALIFERFYMVASKQKIEGTGIGLALAKELTELHGGTIHIKSELNKGSTFTVVIPSNIQADNFALVPEAEKYVATEHESIDNKNINSNKDLVLVIDDDEDMLAFLVNELSPAYNVLSAKNGEEGLNIALNNKPKLILSDIMMPKVSGLELSESLKKNELTSHIPIVLLTASSSQKSKLEGLASGANAFIMKPFNLDELLLTIDNILNIRKQLFEKFKTDSDFYFENSELETQDNKLIQDIINLVLDNIKNNKINADFIAKKIFISRTMLYLKVEALTGQTVNEFIANIRLKKAKQLLLNPENNVSEVSFLVGFTSSSYFSRSFTKVYGCTPREFIKQNATKKRD